MWKNIKLHLKAKLSFEEALVLEEEFKLIDFAGDNFYYWFRFSFDWSEENYDFNIFLHLVESGDIFCKNEYLLFFFFVEDYCVDVSLD